MHKNTKNPPEKPKKQLTRFIIIPLKKPLAKFLISDFRNTDHIFNKNTVHILVENEVSILIEKLKKKGEINPDLNQLKKIEDKFRLTLFFLEQFQLRFINSDLKRLIESYYKEGYHIKKITARKQYRATYYRNRKNLPGILSYFVKKGYTLVKFTFPVAAKSEKNYLPGTLKKDISHLNRAGLEVLIEVFFLIIKHEKTVSKNTISTGIDLIFAMLGLTEKDIKKSTLRKKYFDSLKRQGLKMYSVMFKHIEEEQFFHIKKLYESGKSQSEIARIFGISRGKVKKICNDPEIEKSYKSKTRYGEDFLMFKKRIF